MNTTRSNNHKELVRTVVDLLNGGNKDAHFDKAVEGITPGIAALKPVGLPYSIWQLVEHIRIAQWDILEFSGDPHHRSPEWPEGYWPKEEQPANEQEWKNTIARITADRNAFIKMLEDPAADLYTPFPHGNGQHLLKEALVLADHNSYHTGEIIIIRRLTGNWL